MDGNLQIFAQWAECAVCLCLCVFCVHDKFNCAKSPNDQSDCIFMAIRFVRHFNKEFLHIIDIGQKRFLRFLSFMK